jgi:GxxExxY protein
MENDPHESDIFALCDVIRETSFDIHQFLRNGHREQIYENALVHRLRKKGVTVQQQQGVKVFDEDGTLLGYLRVDLLIEARLICEIKSATAVVGEHVAQLLGYLRATRIEHGLLINFGAPRLQIRKFVLT